MTSPIQVYDGSGKERSDLEAVHIDAWRLWRGKFDSGLHVHQTELLGYIPRPEIIEPPAEQYRHMDDLFMTLHTNEVYRWKPETEMWELVKGVIDNRSRRSGSLNT